LEKQYDPYLMEVYKQASENARMYAKSRFSNLSAFLTYMSVLTAALAVLYTKKEELSIDATASVLVAALGFVVSTLFFALEVRHHYWWTYYELDIVSNLEKQMGYSQYSQRTSSSAKRDWIKSGLFGLSATHATYGIYISSILFFILMGVVSMVRG
jgi:Co/Zn/Cd efflux system component